jgi:hypothetical protein
MILIRAKSSSRGRAFPECTSIAFRLDATADATRAAAEQLTSGSRNLRIGGGADHQLFN